MGILDSKFNMDVDKYYAKRSTNWTYEEFNEKIEICLPINLPFGKSKTRGDTPKWYFFLFINFRIIFMILFLGLPEVKSTPLIN